MGLLTKIYTTINNHIIFDAEADYPPVSEQKEYLSSFGEPKDDIERSYYKYRCLVYYHYSKGQRLLMNVISFFALWVLILFYRMKGFRHDKAMKEYRPQNLLLRKATVRISINDIFPEKLNSEYEEAVDYPGVRYGALYLTKEAMSLHRKVLCRYPAAFHFLLVVLIRLAQADYLLNTFHPACITTYVCEREFSDPILTYYYGKHQVQYHGFMHGDYLFSIDKAFMKLTKYWVWAEHYVKMFSSLRCQFDMEIYTPKKYSGIVKPRESIEDYDYYATYYFSDETKDSIQIVKDALDKIQAKGYKCKVRPHPRFSNAALISSVFADGYEIEDPKKVSIEQSLESTYLTIALVSTVLSQAYYSNKKIVIDDLSNKKKFSQLKEEDYILIDKTDYVLSELIGEE